MATKSSDVDRLPVASEEGAERRSPMARLARDGLGIGRRRLVAEPCIEGGSRHVEQVCLMSKA